MVKPRYKYRPEDSKVTFISGTLKQTQETLERLLKMQKVKSWEVIVGTSDHFRAELLVIYQLDE